MPQDIRPRIRGSKHLDRSVEELELSVRSYNCLKNANIQNHPRARAEERNRIAEDQELRSESSNEIKDILVKMGLSLGMKFGRARPHHLAAAPEPDRPANL